MDYSSIKLLNIEKLKSYRNTGTKNINTMTS